MTKSEKKLMLTEIKNKLSDYVKTVALLKQSYKNAVERAREGACSCGYCITGKSYLFNYYVCKLKLINGKIEELRKQKKELLNAS